jgi:hypothetical protein
MRKQSTASLKRQRAALVRRLPSLQAVLRGSLIERYKRCGKPGCRCAQGPGHGPKYYLSASQSGEYPRVDYVPQGCHKQVEQYLANYRTIKETLKEIAVINSELLRRREPL